MGASRWVHRLEHTWDEVRRRRTARAPEDLRIEPYLGHGSEHGVVVRGRVLDDPTPAEAVEGEGLAAAVRRTVRAFLTDDLPGVPLRVVVAGTDVDDTILETGVHRVARMVWQTILGSALTRTPFPGASELHGDLAAGADPVLHVSSSPWNLHGSLLAFIRHREFPKGPLLLHDLLGTAVRRHPASRRQSAPRQTSAATSRSTAGRPTSQPCSCTPGGSASR